MTSTSNTTMELVPFQSNAVAEFGENFMEALVAQAAMAEEAQRLQDQSTQAKSFLGFEMTKAVLDLDNRFEDVDVYAIFGGIKDVEKLNRRILVHMKVMKREIGEDDSVSYVWSTDKIKNLYDYSAELKESDPAEHTRRFNNRKRLNAVLSDACKAAAALKDQQLTINDLVYTDDPDTGAKVPTIKNAPKQIAGDKAEVQLGTRKPVAGATMSPTMSSLVKLATQAHKPDDSKAKDKKDKGHERDREQMGMSDSDFGSIVNTAIRAIVAQEHDFSPEKLKHLNSLQKTISEHLKEAEAKSKAAAKEAAKKQAAE